MGTLEFSWTYGALEFEFGPPFPPPTPHRGPKLNMAWSPPSVNSAFTTLRTLIPTEPADRKLSKIETLRLASSYISHLGTQLLAGTFVHEWNNCRFAMNTLVSSYCDELTDVTCLGFISVCACAREFGLLFLKQLFVYMCACMCVRKSTNTCSIAHLIKFSTVYRFICHSFPWVS